MTDSEIDAYGLDRKEFNRFIGEFVAPRLRPSRVLDSECSEIPNQAMAICTERWRMADGLERSFGLVAAKTDDGPKCVGLVTSLLLDIAIHESTSAEGASRGESKLRIWAESAERNRAELERLGIVGIFRDESEGLIPWDEWIEHCRAGYEKGRS